MEKTIGDIKVIKPDPAPPNGPDDPVFPQAHRAMHRNGMTLREHYAGEAMKAIIENESRLRSYDAQGEKINPDARLQDIVAIQALSYADALLDILAASRQKIKE